MLDEHPDMDFKDKVVILLSGKATHKTEKQKEYIAPALIEHPDQTKFSNDSRALSVNVTLICKNKLIIEFCERMAP